MLRYVSLFSLVFGWVWSSINRVVKMMARSTAFDILNVNQTTASLRIPRSLKCKNNRNTQYKVSLVWVSSSSTTGSIRDDAYWIFRKNSLELIELSSINKVSLV